VQIRFMSLIQPLSCAALPSDDQSTAAATFVHFDLSDAVRWNAVLGCTGPGFHRPSTSPLHQFTK